MSWLLENLGVIVTVALAVGTAWMTMKTTLSSLVTKVEGLVTANAEREREVSELRVLITDNIQDVSYMQGLNKRLEEDNIEHRNLLKALAGTLSELNVTIGRFDERMKGVESGIKELKK